jgi:hypothetical protein
MKRYLQSALFALIVACSIGQALAQTATSKSPPQNCPEGNYNGPQEGVNRFNQDPYIWFISAEFAKRFCMPEKFLDTSLKGALAIAVRIKPTDIAYCGYLMGRSDMCSAPPIFSLDIYVDNKTTKIPKADPSVDFYAGQILNSGRFINDRRSAARHRGETPDLVGERRPFYPFTGKNINDKDRIDFSYVAVRKGGWASPQDGFIESFYRANWATGIDLISLDKSATLASGDDVDRYNPDNLRPHYYPEDPIMGWAIAIYPKKSMQTPGGFHGENTTYYKNNVPYPSGYSHVIEIPLPLARLKHAFDKKNGQAFFDDLKRATSPR